MAGRLGRRVIHFANLPIKLLMPKTFDNIQEFALKTIPSASKIEIKRVLESLYGFEVDKVRTLNMEGKKKKRGGLVIAKPDYKKAYVTLKSPLSVSTDLYPIRFIEEEKERVNKQRRSSSIVDDGEAKRHWLDDKKHAMKEENFGKQKTKGEKYGNDKRNWRGGRDFSAGNHANANAKFPWTSMRSSG